MRDNVAIIINIVVCIVLLIIAILAHQNIVAVLFSIVGAIGSGLGILTISRTFVAHKKEVALYKNIISNLEPMFDDSQKTLSQYKTEVQNISTDIKGKMDSVDIVGNKINELVEQNKEYLKDLDQTVLSTSRIMPQINSIKDTSKEIFEHINDIQKEYMKLVNISNEARYNGISRIDILMNGLSKFEVIIKDIETESSKAGLAALNAAIGAAKPGAEVQDIAKFFALYAGNIKTSVDEIQGKAEELSKIVCEIRENSNIEITSEETDGLQKDDITLKLSDLNKLSVIINKCNGISQEINTDVEAIKGQIEKQYTGLQEISNQTATLDVICKNINNHIKEK